MDPNRRDFLTAVGIGGAAYAATGPAFSAGLKISSDMAANFGWVSVKSFGALGDGVTDDTTPIDAAIKSMKNGGCLYFPEGTYIISSTLAQLRKHTSVLAVKAPG